MKLRFFAACVAAACVLGVWGGAAAAAQEKKQDEPKVSDAERKSAEKIVKAKGPEAKLQASAEFVKKHPQSALRAQVVQGLANDIAGTPDVQLRISLASAFRDIFTGPGEADLITPFLIDAYVTAEQSAEAFRLAQTYLAQHPEETSTLYRLAVLASNETIKGNSAYAAVGRQYGARAIELIEADKMWPGADAAKWPAFKAESLPMLYRATGIIALKTGDAAGARQLLEKAVALKIKDPGVYLVLADLANSEYELLAKQHIVAAAAEKEAARKKADEKLDRVIEVFAQAVAVSEANPQYQQAAAALRENLTTYYKYRRGGSTDGLQQLIDKYKAQ